MARSSDFWIQFWTCLQPLSPYAPALTLALCAISMVGARTLITAAVAKSAGPARDDIPDMTGRYEFLSEGDTLAILEEEGKLKGYLDVFQSEEESDALLSYPITAGTRQKDH